MTAHHRTTASLRFQRKAREILKAQLPLPCPRCGRTITEDTPWQVGHIIDVALGGTDTLDNVRAECKRCNERAGGKLGARITNTKRKTRTELPKW